jgi:hypothetical protein
MKFFEYRLSLRLNGHQVTTVRIGQHYAAKHGAYMTDELILELVLALDGGQYPVDSTTAGVEYYAADVLYENRLGAKRTYRIIWILEGDIFDVLGVVNAYRRKSIKKSRK